MALDPSDRGELDRLLAEKQRLEDNIEALTEFLTGPNMPGLSGNLIDEEGFPRADVDLYQVRDARNKIARYQNDHRAVMKEIEKALHDLHSKKCVSVPVEGGAASSVPANKRLKLGVGPPFALIDQVFPNSPAAAAGLRVDDKIKRFGTVDLLSSGSVAGCFRDLRSQVVAGQPVQLVVERRVLSGANSTLAPREGGGAPGTSSPVEGEDAVRELRSNAGPTSQNGSFLGSGDMRAAAAPLADHQTSSGDHGTTATAGRGPTTRSLDALMREGVEEETVELVPQSWEGAGLLGCHIVPFDA